MTDEQRRVLTELNESDRRGAFAMACDGPDRAPAHELEKLGYATWRGMSWGSSFWSITDAGRAAFCAGGGWR